VIGYVTSGQNVIPLWREEPHIPGRAAITRRVPFGERAAAGLITPIELRSPYVIKAGASRSILIDARLPSWLSRRSPAPFFPQRPQLSGSGCASV